MAVPPAGAEFELASPPTDGITSLSFAPSSDHLLATSWDTSCRLYDVNANLVSSQWNSEAAVLDACFSGDGQNVYYGGLANVLKLRNLHSNDETIIGRHDKPMRCVEFSPKYNLAVSGAWDGSLKLWDSRQSTAQIKSLQQPDKVFTMALSNDTIVVGCNQRHVTLWDFRNLQDPLEKRESSLKYQTRCIRALSDGLGYALSSSEGRVSIEFFDPAMQAKKYAFKCHRINKGGVETVYPVHALAFHPIYGTFATGGGDGHCNIWDYQNKKRLSQLRLLPTSVAALAFNHNGDKLALASSYCWEEGERDHAPDQIFIKSISEVEAKPKPKKVG